MDFGSLWEETCSLLKAQMNYVSYTTWVEDNMIPTAEENDTLIIGAKMDGMIPMIQKKYLPLIEKCLSESAGRPMKAMILSKSEAEKRISGTDPDGNDPRLNTKYTFERFVVGDSNRFANAAALAAAESPGEAYNPLFIYGGVGLGKTHQMQAIGNRIHQEYPNNRILYLTSETFTNELVDAIQQKKTFEYRAKLRRMDVLLVDDVQFIAGRDATQQEFFNTFNELYNENKQIVLTSDRPPKDIQRLEERLCSRFEWGLVVDIKPPDEETRLAILRNKVEQENMQIPGDVLEEIAHRVEGNVRELEGCLTRLTAYSSMTRTPISMEMCNLALREIFDQRKIKQITAELVMRTVCDFYTVSMRDLIGPTRKREITVPRQIAMYLTRELTGMSLPQIGEVFGGRDHTTVMHSCKTIEAALQTDSSRSKLVDQLKKMVQQA